MANTTFYIENGIVFCTFIGEISLEQIFGFALMNRESWKDLPRIWNFSRADLSGLSYERLQEFIDTIEPDLKNRTPAKVALYADNDRSFPYLRMFESIVEGKSLAEEYGNFKNWEAALNWLEQK